MAYIEQHIKKASFILSSKGNLKASYTDRNKEIRVLCGSI